MKALDFKSVAKICQNHTNLRFFPDETKQLFAGLGRGAAGGSLFQANYGGLLLQFQLLDHRIFFLGHQKSSGF